MHLHTSTGHVNWFSSNRRGNRLLGFVLFKLTLVVPHKLELKVRFTKLFFAIIMALNSSVLIVDSSIKTSSRILGLAYFIVLNEDQPMTFFFVKRFSKSRSWNDQAHDFAKFLTFLLDIFFNVVEFFIDTEQFFAHQIPKHNNLTRWLDSDDESPFDRVCVNYELSSCWIDSAKEIYACLHSFVQFLHSCLSFVSLDDLLILFWSSKF